jgi:carboxymethylenebutenolidase
VILERLERRQLRDDATIELAVCRPKTAARGNVIILPDWYGMSSYYRSMARWLAVAGYVSVVADYFNRTPPLSEYSPSGARERWSSSDEGTMLADISSLVDSSEVFDRDLGQRVGVIGFCLGGTLGLGLGADRSDLAVVCYYGFPEGSDTASVSITAPITQVDEFNNPLLGFWGIKDSAVDLDVARDYVRRLSQRDVPVSSMFYDGVSHGFMSAGADITSRDLYADVAASDSWGKTLTFLASWVG